MSTSRVCSGGGEGVGEGGGAGGDGGGCMIIGGGGCTMTPEVPSLSVDWIIPTTEALPMSSRDIAMIEVTMSDLLGVMAYS